MVDAVLVQGPTFCIAFLFLFLLKKKSLYRMQILLGFTGLTRLRLVLTGGLPL